MASVEAELRDLERQYWQAVKDKDAQAIGRLTEWPCLITGAQGVRQLDQNTYADMLKSPGWTIDRFELDHAQVRLISDDVAVVAYKVREDLTVEEEVINLEAADASVWVRKDGRWRCAVHTESLVGDPFGRDRTPASAAEA